MLINLQKELKWKHVNTLFNDLYILLNSPTLNIIELPTFSNIYTKAIRYRPIYMYYNFLHFYLF